VDRYGDAPDEVDHLSELMLLKIDMRPLRLRTLDAGPGRLVVTLGQDAALDGGKLMQLVQRSKGFYRLTPDLKLISRLDPNIQGNELVLEARKVLKDLHSVRAEDVRH
jgi:transcription-repair coupling factor (superfamily II helicase)